MHFQLEDLKIDLTDENGSIRLITGDQSYLLHNQKFEEIINVVRGNFEVVRNYCLEKGHGEIQFTDINQLSFRIVMTYFYMYNLWRSMYKKEAKRDLKWLDNDFDHPYTKHEIIRYFRGKYPTNYAEKCMTLLSMDEDKFKVYEKRMDDFDNK